MDLALTGSQMAALAGLAGGILLGLAARIGRFCTLGAIEDFMYGESDLRMRMWGLALALSITGTFGLAAFGLFDTASSIYLSQTWNPFASIVGGLMFGYGMAIAGNCGYGALARVGGGDMRALVLVIVMGLSAFMAMSGMTAEMRVWMFPSAPIGGAVPGLAHQLADATGIRVAWIGLAIGGAATVAMLSGRTLRTNGAAMFWSAVIAVSITSGWAATHYLQATSFDLIAVESHTYAAPLGNSLMYLMTSTGSTVSFGLGSVAGVIVGAAIGAYWKGHFRWEACEDPRELRRQMLGAFLMGTGAVIALGCSVGQGLSAFSVLSYSAPVTSAAILCGATIGLRILIGGLPRFQM